MKRIVCEGQRKLTADQTESNIMTSTAAESRCKSLETLTLVDWGRGHTLLELEYVEIYAVIWKKSTTHETLPEGIERSFIKLRQREVNISFESLD